MGNKKQTIITLNGRRYDAATGQAVDDAGAVHAVRPISDVVGRRAENPAPAAATVEPLTAPVPRSSGPKIMDVARQTTHAKHRQPQRATTLMRTTVTKPKPGIKSQVKVMAPATAAPTTLATVQPKWPVSQVSPTRLTRAEQVAKSAAISKFAANSDIVASAPAAVQATAPQSASSATEHDSRDLFERAIAGADSHLEPQYDSKKLAKAAKKQAKLAAKTKRERPVHHHLASVVATSVAVLAIGGFIGLQNRAALTLRFANAKAGFQASLPNYKPDGYSVGGFTYSAGNVGTSFHDAAGNRSYTLNQQTTKWDSQALLDNFIRINYSSYQVLQSGQQIVYMYGKNNASWVKDGVWYQLTTDGSLSTSQVLNIATSV